MELDPAHQLDVVRHHVPGELVPGHLNLGAKQTAANLAHRRERFRKDFVQYLSDLATQIALDAATAVRTAQLGIDLLSLDGIRGGSLAFAQIGDARLELIRALSNDAAQLLGLRAQLLLG